MSSTPVGVVWLIGYALRVMVVVKARRAGAGALTAVRLKTARAVRATDMAAEWREGLEAVVVKV
jgi:hypothetical protein